MFKMTLCASPDLTMAIPFFVNNNPHLKLVLIIEPTGLVNNAVAYPPFIAQFSHQSGKRKKGVSLANYGAI